MTKRYNNLSLYRLLATLAIFLFHFFYLNYNVSSSYINLLSSAATGFAVLSGYLFAQKEIKNYKKFVVKSLLNLVIPLVLTTLTVSLVVLVVVLKDYTMSQYFDCWFGTRLYDGRRVGLLDNVWYVPYIFVCYLALPLLFKLSNKEKIGKIFVPPLIMVELIVSYFVGNPLVFASFTCGFFMSKACFKRDMTFEEKNTWLDFVFPTLIIILCISLYILDVDALKIGENFFLNRFIYLSQIILRAVFSSQLFSLFIKSFKFLNKINKSIKTFEFTDKHSYYFFLIHEAFMTGVINFSLLSTNIYLSILISFGVSFIFAVINFVIGTLILDVIKKKL